MPTPLRLLRASIQHRLDKQVPLKPREIERRDMILAYAQTEMAQFGRSNLSFRRFSDSVRLSPNTVKRLFADLDALLGEILRRHLMRISKALGEIPRDAPGRAAKLREAYLQATRKPFGGFNEAHLLLIRDRHLLPEDELASIEGMRDGIGQLISQDFPEATLDLLDAPNFSPAQIERAVATLRPPDAVSEPLPSDPEPAAPPPAPPQQNPDAKLCLAYKGPPKDPEDPPIDLYSLLDHPMARAGPSG